MIITMILNNEPYGNEMSYNALRYATALVAGSDASVRIFLLGSGVVCGLKDQKPPEGHYNIAHMLSILIKRNVVIRACGTCLDARGIHEDMLIDGVGKDSMSLLVD